MAALLRQGARRIGGSVLQRTQAALTSPAVAEERRRLVPRRMTTDVQNGQVQKKKEELYDVLSKTENSQDRVLLQDLVRHIDPRPHEKQWRQLRSARKTSNFMEMTGTALFVSFVVFVSSVPGVYDAAMERVERENQVKKRVAVERESRVETLME